MAIEAATATARKPESLTQKTPPLTPVSRLLSEPPPMEATHPTKVVPTTFMPAWPAMIVPTAANRPVAM